MEQTMAWSSLKWKAVVLDFLERAGWSAGQVFFATLLAGGGSVAVVGLPWKYASVLAVGAAVSSIVLTALQYLGRFTNLGFWPDLIVRLAKTFLGSIGASLSAAKVFDVTTFHWSTALNVAALATVGALAKGLLARGGATVAATAGTTAHAGTTTPASTGQAAAPGGAKVSVGRVPAETVAAYASPSTLPNTTYLDAIRR
jgi:hypothetical protein